MGGTPTFGPSVGGGTPKIAVERKMEQGFHSGGYNESHLHSQSRPV